MSPLKKAEAALADKATAKKMAEKVVDKKEAVKAAAMSKSATKKKMEEVIHDAEERTMMPSLSKEVEKVDLPPVEISFEPKENVAPPAYVSPLAIPANEALCLIRKKGRVMLARYRYGDFYIAHAGTYSELIDRVEAWTTVPEF